MMAIKACKMNEKFCSPVKIEGIAIWKVFEIFFDHVPRFYRQTSNNKFGQIVKCHVFVVSMLWRSKQDMEKVDLALICVI